MNRPGERLRIIVGGMAAQFPLGGVLWDYLHYVLALDELGHEVWYFEDTWVWPYDPVKRYPVNDASYASGAIRGFLERHAPHLAERWHYLLLHDQAHGMSRERFAEVAGSADVFLNVSGACMFPEGLPPRCVKVFLDTDPGYNQIMLTERHGWSENIERWCAHVAAHDRHLTYAENIGAADCRVPRLGFDWRVTRCPASLARWASVKQAPPPPGAALSTIMGWDYFRGRLTHEGREYFSKSHEFERFMVMPARSPLRLRVGIGGHKTPWETIRAAGWEAIDAQDAARSEADYQRFVADSAGEFSVAKNVYVDTRSGWFSCRTACYLAGGRPAVVQDTGWSRHVPSGEGLMAFTTMDEAAAAIAEVAAHPARHRAAAYEVAREYLAADRVMPPMLRAIYAGPGEGRDASSRPPRRSAST